jgi:hypothetical protein
VCRLDLTTRAFLSFAQLRLRRGQPIAQCCQLVTVCLLSGGRGRVSDSLRLEVIREAADLVAQASDAYRFGITLGVCQRLGVLRPYDLGLHGRQSRGHLLLGVGARRRLRYRHLPLTLSRDPRRYRAPQRRDAIVVAASASSAFTTARRTPKALLTASACSSSAA